jgi:hypothetical protein
MAHDGIDIQFRKRLDTVRRIVVNCVQL